MLVSIISSRRALTLKASKSSCFDSLHQFISDNDVTLITRCIMVHLDSQEIACGRRTKLTANLSLYLANHAKTTLWSEEGPTIPWPAELVCHRLKQKDIRQSSLKEKINNFNVKNNSISMDSSFNFPGFQQISLDYRVTPYMQHVPNKGVEVKLLNTVFKFLLLPLI